MVETDFVDLTPRAIDTSSTPKQTKVVFQETEWQQINDNPSGLTKEGVEKKIELWKQSNNRHVVTKYQTMLARCVKLTESGKTKDGLVIYSRDVDGSAKWTSKESAFKKKDSK